MNVDDLTPEDLVAASGDLIYAIRAVAAAIGDPRHAEHGATPSVAEALVLIATAMGDHAAAVRELAARS